MLYQLLTLVFSLAAAVWATDVHAMAAAWSSSPMHAVFPTSFTRGVQPIPIHSHNDYWRTVPLFSALSVGAQSVEADVWEYDGELYVGHSSSSLSRNRTFASLYVNPIREILDRQNSRAEFTTKGHAPFGVFDEDPQQTLNLFVDLKTPGHPTLPVVLRHLEPLRSPVNYLTHFNGTHVNHGAVTVHLTGDTPFEDLIANTTYRDAFFDAPLTDLASGKYTPENSLIASTPFSKNVGSLFWPHGDLTTKMMNKLHAQIKEAHDHGLMARYWSTPNWPISLRNRVWHRLVEAGVDLLNVDDLHAASQMAWK